MFCLAAMTCIRLREKSGLRMSQERSILTILSGLVDELDFCQCCPIWKRKNRESYCNKPPSHPQHHYSLSVRSMVQHSKHRLTRAKMVALENQILPLWE